MPEKEQHTSAVVCGIAKRIATELDQLPMETHQAVVSMVANLFQHRGLQEQRRLEAEKLEREEARQQKAAAVAAEQSAFLTQRQRALAEQSKDKIFGGQRPEAALAGVSQ